MHNLMSEYESLTLGPLSEFDLSKKQFNKQIAINFLNKNKETISEDDEHLLFRTGGQLNGYIVALDKKRNCIDYLVKFDKKSLEQFDSNAMQAMVWRRFGAPSITDLVFFDYLLQRSSIVVSSTRTASEILLERPRGETFWIDIMGRATRRGGFVGLYNQVNHSLIKFDGGSLYEWLIFANDWLKNTPSEPFRYVVSNEIL